ncbi:BF3164 family lipoprotein [Parabacteroides pacaensis]|uniref:BF3164 family lipoprotein n=1 Tax=Parabacteroides pacaensis TaxID=2086575 RepID=UPI00131CC4B1|nr:BF3164 family lipoprotein [Parabacteroides pacaensis]
MKYYYILFIFTCLSCSFNEKKSALEKLKEVNNIEVNGSVLQNDSIIWSSQLVDLIDNRLIIQNFSTDYAFSVFHIENDKVIKENDLIQNGNGPYEMIYPVYFADKAAQCIYFYDVNGVKINMYKIDIYPFSNLYQKQNWHNINIPSPKNYFWSTNGAFATMRDSSCILLGGSLFKTNMLSLVTPDKRIIDTDIIFPKDKCDAEPIIKRQVYNNGGIKKKATGNQFLYYCLSGNYAEIISFDDANKVTRKVIVNDLPIYTITKDGINPIGTDTNLRGLKAYTTNNYIYIMPYPLRRKDFIGKDDYKGYPTYYNNELYVFNWNGDFVKSYTFDKLIDTFVVPEDDSCIFGVTIDSNNDYRIIKFIL